MCLEAQMKNITRKLKENTREPKKTQMQFKSRKPAADDDAEENKSQSTRFDTADWLTWVIV